MRKGALTPALVALAAWACNQVLQIDPPRTADTEAEGGTRACTSGLTACGGECVDTRVDLRHCGACGVDCQPVGSEVKICLPEGTGRCVACPQGSVACGTACADLDTDDAHCSACDHSCLGTGCSGGACRPLVVHRNFGLPTFLGVDPTHLHYFGTAGVSANYLGRAPKGGSACDGADERCRVPMPDSLLTDDAGRVPTYEYFALDANHLYAAAVGRGVVRRPRDGGAWEEVLAASVPLFRMTADDGSLFLGLDDATYLTRLDTAAPSATHPLGVTSSGTPNVGTITSLEGQDALLVWISETGGTGMSPGLHRLPKHAETPCRDDDCLWVGGDLGGDLGGFAVHGEALYYSVVRATGDGTSRIYRQPVTRRCPTGPCAELLVEGIPNNAPSLPVVADGRHVYWAQAGAVQFQYEIRRQPVDAPCSPPPPGGCGEKFLTDDVGRVRDMIQDDTAIYAFVFRAGVVADLVRKVK